MCTRYVYIYDHINCRYVFYIYIWCAYGCINVHTNHECVVDMCTYIYMNACNMCVLCFVCILYIWMHVIYVLFVCAYDVNEDHNGSRRLSRFCCFFLIRLMNSNALLVIGDIFTRNLINYANETMFICRWCFTYSGFYLRKRDNSE